MLIIALVLAAIGLAALVFAVVTSNELVAWVCIGASVLGVVLLIIDALQERQRRETGGSINEPASAEGNLPRFEEVTAEYEEVTGAAESGTRETFYADYPEDASGEGSEDAGTGADEVSPAESATDDHNTR